MSEFYKRKRNLIIQNYKYLGIKEKASFYFYRFSIIVTSFVLLQNLSQWVKPENNQKDGWAILILIGFTLMCFFISKSDSKKQQEDKMKAVFRFIKEPDVNIETVDALVEEIEKYNKKMRTFATWITGLSATFIILLATIGTNFLIKTFDVYLKVVPMDELPKVLESINQSGSINDKILGFLDIGIVLLFIFLIVILIIYNVFAMFTFVKGQILIFLFDVRYEVLSGDRKENKNEDDELVENT